MIVKINRDYTLKEISQFIDDFPKRYEKLCKIIGEYHLGVRRVYASVVLPYKKDYGAVAISIPRDGKIDIIAFRFF